MTSVSSLFSQLDSTHRAGNNGNANLADNFNSFLNMLTVQLQNQDPLEPLDTNQFTQQLVQMTGVEQTVSMNERLGALIDAQETQRIQTAVDFVGKQVDALGDIVPLDETGADMFYALDAQASGLQVQIIQLGGVNEKNSPIRTFFDADAKSGVHRLHWNGLGDDGLPADPTKTYRLQVRPIAANGDAMSVKIGFSGIANELRNDNGVLTLVAAGRSVNLDEIVAARTAPPKPTAVN